jgi:hypothetical protein
MDDLGHSARPTCLARPPRSRCSGGDTGRHHRRPRPAAPTPRPDVLGQATARGWQTGKGKHPTANHPDGTAFLQYRREDRQAVWWAAAHTPGLRGRTVPLWTATFSEHTPMHALESFAAALADPEPVLRPPGHIPFASAPQAAITPYPVLPSQLEAMRRHRATAARAAAWSRATSVFARIRPRAAGVWRPPASPLRAATRPAPPQPPRTRWPGPINAHANLRRTQTTHQPVPSQQHDHNGGQNSPAAPPNRCR